jgi:hypothetical protein
MIEIKWDSNDRDSNNLTVLSFVKVSDSVKPDNTEGLSRVRASSANGLSEIWLVCTNLWSMGLTFCFITNGVTNG